MHPFVARPVQTVAFTYKLPLRSALGFAFALVVTLQMMSPPGSMKFGPHFPCTLPMPVEFSDMETFCIGYSCKFVRYMPTVEPTEFVPIMSTRQSTPDETAQRFGAFDGGISIKYARTAMTAAMIRIAKP